MYHTNDKYAYNGTFADKYEEGILYTVAMLGFMSLKNSDHAVSGPNPASTKRILRDAIATRKAADVLLASGAIVLLGTWSNGIAVGPGAGFVPVSHTSVTPITAAKPAKTRTTVPNRKTQLAADRITRQAEWDAQASRENASCDWPQDDMMTVTTCDWQPAVILGPAYVAPLGNPPGMRIIDDWTGKIVIMFWHKHLNRTLRGNEYAEPADTFEKIGPAQPVTDAPTPIRAMPAYTAAVGDTVSLTYSHENGTTTDRVVTIHRMTASGFRGYDHTYRKARNYHFDHISGLALHTGEEDLAAG